MNETDFARAFERLYHETYARAARRIPDKRARLSPETTALLLHLGGTGPVSLGELARHTGRAQSTASAMVDHLIEKGLLERDRDPDDGRRHLIWMSAAGKSALAEALQVLDATLIAGAARVLSAPERAALIEMFTRLSRAIDAKGPKP